MSDRTVHASTLYGEVVRYDRAGAWYIEDTAPVRRYRIRVKLQEVVEWITEQQQSEVIYHFGLPGGLQFDKRVRDVLARIGDAR